jgi:inorganic pyrophosphatase
MPKSLDRLPLIDRDSGQLNVVIETPKGSRNKYKYDGEVGALRLGAVLGKGLAFPYDYGFFPSTLGEDGDPLDVLLFLDHAAPPGSIATARLIGVLEVRQKSEGGPWQRNDRFFAVATQAHGYEAVKKLSDLRHELIDEIEAFFTHYTGLEGKRLDFLARRGPKRAQKLLKTGTKAFKTRR